MTTGRLADNAALALALALALAGSSAYTVTGLVGDVDASGSSGALSVTTANNTGDDTISITTGSGAATIAGTTAGDQISVDATELATDGKLTLSGASAFVVTGLAGDLGASAASGSVTAAAVGETAQVLVGGLGADTLAGGDGDDRLHGGAGQATDYLVGGDGTDRAIFIGHFADYDIDVVRTTIDGEAGVRIFKVTHKTSQAFDYVNMDVEWLTFVTDLDAYLTLGTVNDEWETTVPPIALLDAEGNEVGAYATLEDAIAAAEAGYRIEIEDDTDLSGEGTVQVTVENLTISGGAGVTIIGLELAPDVVALRLDGEFSTRVQGNALNNLIVGNAGDNTILGGDGDDTIVGGGGQDVLIGGAGDDVIVPGARVVAQGGAGNDRFILDSSAGDDPVQFNVAIPDFRTQYDVLDFGHLRTADGEPLTLADLGLVASPSAHIHLDGFLLDTSAGEPEAVSGALTLSMVNALRMASSDFSFDPGSLPIGCPCSRIEPRRKAKRLARECAGLGPN